MGVETLSYLVDKGLVAEPADFYKLEEKDLDIPGWGKHRGAQLLASIGSSRGAPVAKFVEGLGIK